MKLKAVILEGFRSYKNRTRIDFEQFTALVGRNDAGKSSVLEALEIFFNSEQIKLDHNDLCVHSSSQQIRIGCIFSDLPEKLVIDSLAETTLQEELILNEEGHLEIHKVFDCGLKTLKERVFAISNHPSNTEIKELLLKKNEELKAVVTSNGVSTEGIQLRSNVQLRKRLREHFSPLTLQLTEIPLDNEDAKKIWDQLKPHLPIYALFRSDRPSQDGDSEAQNPLKVAVEEALKVEDIQEKLQEIQAHVKNYAKNVAERTLEKLRDLDGRLASELIPDFKVEPKWDTLFKFSLTGDDGIPINKRGSGVRRLILISFFRAQAERRRTEKDASNIIYAIEEPETSQNPINQRLLIEALLELSEQQGIQVIITTHTPGLAGLIPGESLRHIQQDEERTATISSNTPAIYLQISQELGITADKRLQVLICVEGPSDVEHLLTYSSLLHEENVDLVNLIDDPRVAIVPVGGSNLKQWVDKHYLKTLGIPEVHIYDRDLDTPPKYAQECALINQRTDGSWAVLTTKNEIENYLHPAAVKEALGIECEMNANEDVVLKIVLLDRQSGGEVEWDQLTPEKKKKLESALKKRLYREVLPKMTLERLREADEDAEIEGWLRRISAMLV